MARGGGSGGGGGYGGARGGGGLLRLLPLAFRFLGVKGTIAVVLALGANEWRQSAAADRQAAEALAQIKARRYYEPYLSDPRPIVLLGAGGFLQRAIRCVWEELER